MQLFTNAEVLRTSESTAEQLEARIRSHAGRVLISSWAVDPPEAVHRSSQLDHWDEAGVRALMERLRPHLREVARDRFQIIWEMIPEKK